MVKSAENAKNTVRIDNLPRTVLMQRSVGGRPTFTMVDQTKLPFELSFIEAHDWGRVVEAIKRLEVRGAPAIGIAGAAAVALAACDLSTTQGLEPSGFLPRLREDADIIAMARPTAVNLAWAVERSFAHADAALKDGASSSDAAQGLVTLVCDMIEEDERVNRAIGKNGAALLPANARVLTHCNAGSLATAYYGTALGVVYAAAETGGVERVFADETRPIGQGARLTAWELAQAGVPVTLICDNMAASVMSAGKVDAVVVGADRIASNGDVANKIGTLGVAISAARFGIPFYVAAPSSTIDMSLSTGELIPIEERAAFEVMSVPIEGVEVFNPAFDVTPSSLITAIITEKGVFSPEKLAQAYDGLLSRA